MSQEDLAKIPKQISPDKPSGEPIDYDPVFEEIDRELAKDAAAEAKAAVKWSEVKAKLVTLCSRTQDVRVGVHLAHTLLSAEGFPGLAQGLSVLRGWLEGSWETLHPQIETPPNKPPDPMMRTNAVGDLCAEGLLRHLRRTVLVESRQYGRISLRDIRVARKEPGYSPDEGRPPLDLAAVDAAFKDADVAAVRQVHEAVGQCCEHLQGITQTFGGRFPPDRTPDLAKIRQELEKIQKEIETRVGSLGGPTPSGGAPSGQLPANGDDPGASGSGGGTPGPSGEIRSPQDVCLMLDKICAYYERHEGSSPVPLLLKRAGRLVSKNFLQIIEDLAPDARGQLEKLTGAKLEEGQGGTG